jgi:hypothetical protein
MEGERGSGGAAQTRGSCNANEEAVNALSGGHINNVGPPTRRRLLRPGRL